MNLASPLPYDSWRPATSLFIGCFDGIIAALTFALVAASLARRAGSPLIIVLVTAWSVGLIGGEFFAGSDGVRHLFLPAALGAASAAAAGVVFFLLLSSKNAETSRDARRIELDNERETMLGPVVNENRKTFPVATAIVAVLAMFGACAATYLRERGVEFDPYTLIVVPFHALSAGICAAIAIRVLHRRRRAVPTSFALGLTWLAGSVFSEWSTRAFSIGSAAIILRPEIFPFLIGPLCMLMTTWCIEASSPKPRP